MEQININDIYVGDRARKDLGDLASLMDSIREYGIIQAIVLTRPDEQNPQPRLVVGGRRLAALKALNRTTLMHGTDFIWRDETDELRLKSVELEENLKRKEMSWQEVVEAKAKLLTIMESIHGVQKFGKPSMSERASGATEGFGTRKLAALLGESIATTSQDLQLANLIKVMPALAKAENKSSALREGTMNLVVMAIRNKEIENKKAEATAVAKAIASGSTAEQATATHVLSYYSVYEGDFRDNIGRIPNKSVDLVFTDLPYGVEIDQNTMQGITFADKRKTIVDLLPDIARESYRILRDERYAVYWFGFNFYTELRMALEKAGFQVNPIPVVWIKHRNYSPNPLRWFTSGYEQALVACKGDAKLVRPGSNDLIDLPNVANNLKLQVAQKPVELCEKFILDMTLPMATIVDMFAGSGSTGVAALTHGRKALLFEKDVDQCTLIRNRLSGVVKLVP